MRALIAALAFPTILGCGPDPGPPLPPPSRHGVVRVVGAPDASGVVVTDDDGTGVIAGATTDASGAYTLLQGSGETDLVTATARSTVERTRSANVGARLGVVPTFTFTAAGGLAGHALLGGNAADGNAGIVVQIDDVVTFTDDSGDYALPTVAAGPHRIRFLAAGFEAAYLDDVVVSYGTVATVPDVVLVRDAPP